MHLVCILILINSVLCIHNDDKGARRSNIINIDDLYTIEELGDIMRSIIYNPTELRCHTMLLVYIMLAREKHDKITLLSREKITEISKGITHLPDQMDSKLYNLLKASKYPILLQRQLSLIANTISIPIYMYTKLATDESCPNFKELVDNHMHYSIKPSQRLLGKAVYLTAIAQNKVRKPARFDKNQFRSMSSNLFSFWSFMHDLRWRLQLDISGTPFDVMMILNVGKISIKKKNQLNDLNNAYFESLYSVYIRLKLERALGVFQEAGHPIFGEYGNVANVSDTSFIRLMGFVHKNKSGKIFEYNFGFALVDDVKKDLIDNLKPERTLLQFILLDKTHTNSPFYHSNQYFDADMLYKMIRNELCADPSLANGDSVSVAYAQKVYSTPEFLHDIQRDGGLTIVLQISPNYYKNIETTMEDLQRIASMPLLTEIYHKVYDPKRISLLGNCHKNEEGEFMCIGNFGKFLGMNIRRKIANYLQPGSIVIQILIQGVGDIKHDNWDSLNSSSIANRILTRLKPAYTELFIKRVQILKTVEEKKQLDDCDHCRKGYISVWWFLYVPLPVSLVTMVFVLFLLENTKVGIPWYLSKFLVKHEKTNINTLNAQVQA